MNEHHKIFYKNVFGPITNGLRVIHQAKAFHGNMLNGVAIKSTRDSTPIGIFFNMTGDLRQEVPNEDITRLQSKEVGSLKGTWGLNLTTFWKEKEQIVFIKMMYLLYDLLSKPKYGSKNFDIPFFHDYD